MLENKLGITNAIELAKEEERITKKKALKLFENTLMQVIIMKDIVCIKQRIYK